MWTKEHQVIKDRMIFTLSTVIQYNDIFLIMWHVSIFQILDMWSEWTEWSSCTQKCGGGVQSRDRRCLDGTSCIGSSQELRVCNTYRCSGETSAINTLSFLTISTPTQIGHSCVRYFVVYNLLSDHIGCLTVKPL